MKKRVFVAADVDQSFFDRIMIDDRFETRHLRCHDEQSLIGNLADAEVLVTRYANQVTSKVLDSSTSLRLLAQGTSGLDNIDLARAAERNIIVLGLPGENANAVAELVIGFMIMLTRTVPAYNEMVRAGRWSRDDCATRRELRSFRLGIIGLGRVGSRVAAIAKNFGMSIVACDPYITPEQATERDALLLSSLEELLGQSDIVTCHVPLTKETDDMLAGRQLDLLPAGAIVINTCRGPVVNATEALRRLESGHLQGLAMDVYDQEPPKERTWPADPRLITTPHIAGCSRESKASIGKMLYEKICDHYGFVPKN
ncbi:MAG TPA: NAD(P)-dependent oxidoreductase [Thermoanaerobaculia bacterium]|nr:NAD(P)-dependent oxidoreductase [Thermoanaerobaculia bacterium]